VVAKITDQNYAECDYQPLPTNLTARKVYESLDRLNAASETRDYMKVLRAASPRDVRQAIRQAYQKRFAPKKRRGKSK
jgi:hypothetical protein